MKKRWVSAILALCLAGTVLGGCGKQNADTPSTDAAKGETTAEGSSQATADEVTIEMWYHISPDQATVLLAMIDEFQ